MGPALQEQDGSQFELILPFLPSAPGAPWALPPLLAAVESGFQPDGFGCHPAVLQPDLLSADFHSGWLEAALYIRQDA